MKAVNNKILYELLPEEDQPKKTIFSPGMDMLKRLRVLDKGSKVDDINVGDIITVYVHDMNQISSERGFCNSTSVIFTNDIPPKGTVHVNNINKESLSNFANGDVIQSNSEDIQKEDKIYFKQDKAHILPDNTEIISERQIFYKK